MSDDYDHRVGESAAGAEDDGSSLVIRISLRARSNDAASTLWSAIQKRLAKKKAEVRRAPAQAADASVFLLDSEDFKTEEAARAVIAEASAGAAPRFLLEPEGPPSAEIGARMMHALETLARREGFTLVPCAPKQPSTDRAEENLKMQAKAVAKALLREPDRSAVASPGDAVDKPAKKAGKTAGKAERKERKKESAPAERPSASRGEADAKKAEQPPSTGELDHDKAARKAAKQASKEERKHEKSAQKAERKSSKSASDAGVAQNALTIAMDGFEDSWAAALREAIAEQAAAMGLVVNAADPAVKFDIALYGFGGMAAADISARACEIAKDRARVRILVAPAVRTPEEDAAMEADRAVSADAAQCDAVALRLWKAFERYGVGDSDRRTQASIAARAILEIAAARLSKRSIALPESGVPPDLAGLRDLAARPSEFLAKLSWSKSIPPRLLRAPIDKVAMEAFVARRIALDDDVYLDIVPPIAWPSEFPSRGAERRALGLDFLIPILSYWYSKANARDMERIAEIDALLKERGVTASDILAQAGAVILDFAKNHPRASQSPAWSADAMAGRCRAMMFFVLCCKMALKRRIKFDEAACAAVSHELFQLIELLRGDAFYRPCAVEGVDQDCLLVGLALALRKSSYAERLLGDSLERLQSLQLDIGLTSDGVWRVGTYSDHCALLGSLRILLGDLDEAGVAHLESIVASAKKMTLFAEAMLKSDGRPPAIDAGKRKSFANQVSGAQRLLASAGGKGAKPKAGTRPRVTETYVFRDAQYFISHTSRSVSPDSSLFVLHAQSPSQADGDPGGLTLALAHGERDLLVRAEPDRAAKKDKSARRDPALGNGYHLDGVGFDPDAPPQDRGARLVKSWRGEGWAAAKAVDGLNPLASIVRLAVHFKAAHALLVVDEIEALDGADHEVEQFWHIGPDFTSPDAPAAKMVFGAKEGGGLVVAFDAIGAVGVASEGDGFCVRRSARLSKGALASFFQWSAEPAQAEISLAKAEGGGWSIRVAGAGLKGAIAYAGDMLRYEPDTES